MTSRLVAVAVAFVVVAAGCSSSDGSGGGGRGDGNRARPVSVQQVASSPKENVISALVDPDAEGLPTPLIDTAQLLPGGPPPDGIPAVDDPTFLRADDVDFLDDDEAVLALEIGDAARAYPIQVMTWHEIVNDTVDGVPVAVQFCPLCNSAVASDRRLGDRVLDFGTSGLLYRSALVMYDRQTESLWSHFTGRAVAGVLTGETLRTYPVATVSWADWLEANPEGVVLSRDTGFDRDYGRNPYPGYDDADDRPFLFEGEIDGRLAPKTRVVTIRGEREAVAIVQAELADRRVIEVEVDGKRLVAWLKPGTASALDGGAVASGRDVGATGVFVPSVDARQLTFEADGSWFRDEETGTRWDILGHAVSGPLTGEQLDSVEHLNTFWFAWAAFEPDTRIVS